MIDQIAVAGEKPEFPIARMCGWAQVSESGFYAWRRRTLCRRSSPGVAGR
ncbi:MAG: hypothetical protein R2733_14165 [Acidimicrobiales bacterium]